MIHAVISGTGSYLPLKSVSNTDLEQRIDTTDEWIFARTGIKNRRIANDEETTSYMAEQAALAALKDSGLKADDIDLILVASCTPNHVFPSMACHVQHALKTKNNIPSFDISAACSGFMYAMDVANQYIRSGAARHVMVVGSESMSRAVDWNDRSTCILFGDGAAAVVFSASEKKTGILASVLHAMHDEERYLKYESMNSIEKATYIGMKGNEVFKLAVNIMSDVVDEVLELCQFEQSDINWLIPHQANIRIIKAIAKKLNLPMSQVVQTIQDHGNTSAASIPLALDHAIKTGLVKRGDTLLLESFGGGMTWGAAVIQY